MNDSLVSIVVPIYNTEKYLNKCINSILKQTYKNIEIILVNDGSTDRCGLICDNYALQDNRIKIISKKNEGVSVARNAGIAIATGKYLLLIDSDDYISCYMVETMLKYMSDDIDLIVCSAERRDESGKYLFSKINIDETVTAGKLASDINNFDQNTDLRSPCNKMYKLDSIKNHNLEFKKNLKYGEDTCFVINYLMNSKTIKFIPDVLITFVLNKNQTTGNFVANMHEQLSVVNDEIEIFVKNNLPKEQKYDYSSGYYREFKLLFLCIENLYRQKNGINYWKSELKKLLENDKIKEMKSNYKPIELKRKFPLLLLKSGCYTTMYFGFYFLIKLNKKMAR